ncbi:hypothetical protein ACJ41O_002623 [Fusarium nematophilum]
MASHLQATIGESYGPLVRLWGIHPSKLPPVGAQTEDLKALLASIAVEALPFISSVPSEAPPSVEPIADLHQPRELWKPKSVKTFQGSTATVHLFERSVDAETLTTVAQSHPTLAVGRIQPEAWALRRSTHLGNREPGTAAWDEFVRCFKEEHAKAEKAFTPSVVSTSRLQEWDCAGIETEVDGTTWTDWTLRREEAVHQLPGPLSRRLFPVLQATAAAQGRREFLVVQIAIQENDGEATHEGAIRAAYTSIERIRELEGGRIEWVMGTTSDAKGLVPMWVQRMALAGEIAKDVGMFLRWVAEEREKGRDSEVIGDLNK